MSNGTVPATCAALANVGQVVTGRIKVVPGPRLGPVRLTPPTSDLCQAQGHGSPTATVWALSLRIVYELKLGLGL